MPHLDVYDIEKKKVGEIDLSDLIFGSEVNEHLIHEVVKMQLANRRAGTAKTKTRAEVSGGNAKPWKQKGTGRARSGANTSPIWVRGGSAFGMRRKNESPFAEASSVVETVDKSGVVATGISTGVAIGAGGTAWFGETVGSATGGGTGC